jgi:hypothetical protein
VTGSVKLGEQTDAQSVIVWGDRFPSWLLVLKELQLKARVVIVSSEVHCCFMKGLVDKDCLIVTEEAAKTFLNPEKIGNCSLCLFDGRLAANKAEFLQTCGITGIIGTRGLRREI